MLECDYERVCQCGQDDYGDSTSKRSLYSLAEEGASWYEIVERDTVRNLTHASGISPAISALAREYRLPTYIAGLA